MNGDCDWYDGDESVLTLCYNHIIPHCDGLVRRAGDESVLTLCVITV